MTYTRMINAFEEGDYESSLREAIQLSQSYPSEAGPLYCVALSYENLGEETLASITYDMVIEQNPFCLEALIKKSDLIKNNTGTKESDYEMIRRIRSAILGTSLYSIIDINPLRDYAQFEVAFGNQFREEYMRESYYYARECLDLAVKAKLQKSSVLGEYFEKDLDLKARIEFALGQYTEFGETLKLLAEYCNKVLFFDGDFEEEELELPALWRVAEGILLQDSYRGRH